jgi:iron complex transport system ATP-binding protein
MTPEKAKLIDGDGPSTERSGEGAILPGVAGSPGLPLSLESVSLTYPASGASGLEALSGVSLGVGEGEVAALIGPNGAGKSSLLRVAAGLVRPARGSVRTGGDNPADLEPARRARSVAFVPQTEVVAAGFRVRQVVAMGRAPHQGSWMRQTAQDRDAVERAIDRCDLREVSGRRIETLSCGEQRRVAVARALAQGPRLLLLDEPGAFFDVRHRLELYAMLAERARADQMACVVAMHDLEAAARFASLAILMRRGRLIAVGPPEQVMTPETLRATFDAEVAVGTHPQTGRQYFIPLRPSVA